MRDPRGLPRGAWATLVGLAVFLSFFVADQGPLQAQNELPTAWRGDAGVLVVVTDETGGPVPGARVLVRQPDAEQAISLLTDEAGRAEAVALATGEWQVDVQREGFMLLTAYVRLESGKAPRVAFSSKQRTGTYWASLEAVFLPAGTALTPAVAAGRKSPDQVRKAAAEDVRDAERAQERADREQRRGRLARVIEEPKSDPAPVEVTEVQLAPPLELSPAAPAAPPDRPAQTFGPAGSSEPRLAGSSLRQAGACPECRPGEWSITTSALVVPGAADGGCEVDETRLRALATDLAADLAATTTTFAGAITEAGGNDVLRMIPVSWRESFAPRVADAVHGAGCVAIGIVLPKNSRYVGFRYRAGDATTKGDCLLRQPCQVGDAEWPASPLVIEGAAGLVVWNFFRNGQPKEVEAEATVYFRPPRGWLPPSQ